MLRSRNTEERAERRSRYLSHVTEVLSSSGECAADDSQVDQPESDEAVPGAFLLPSPPPSDYEAMQGGGSLRPPTALERTQDDRPQAEPRIPNGVRQIADALAGMLWEAIQELSRQAGYDTLQLMNTAERMSCISTEILKIRSDLEVLSSSTHMLEGRDDELRSELTSLQNRTSLESTSTRQHLHNVLTAQEQTTQAIHASSGVTSDLQSRILKVSEGIRALDQNLRAQAEETVRLNSSCTRLELAYEGLKQRLYAQDEAIEAVRAEVRQPRGLMDRLLGSLRTLDMRREPRLPCDRAVQVFVSGEGAEAVPGRIIDASTHGLGLVMSQAVRVGSEVRVDLEGTLLSGRVTRCESRGTEYVVGVHLAQPQPSSSAGKGLAPMTSPGGDGVRGGQEPRPQTVTPVRESAALRLLDGEAAKENDHVRI